MIRRGDVHFVDLDPVRGREQAGRRPAVVVSDDALNAQNLVVTVIVGTDARNVARSYSTNVLVPALESGLPRDTVFLGFQVRALDRSRFVDPSRGHVLRVGTLPASRMTEIDAALRVALGL